MDGNKKVILEMFHSLTEIEKVTALDTAGEKEYYIALAGIYIMAIERCRHLLEVILKEIDVRIKNEK